MQNKGGNGKHTQLCKVFLSVSFNYGIIIEEKNMTTGLLKNDMAGRPIFHYIIDISPCCQVVCLSAMGKTAIG